MHGGMRPKRPLGRVVIGAGDGAKLPNRVAKLSAATRLPGDLAAPMGAMRIGKTGLTDEQLAHIDSLVAVPVGLALGVAS